MISFLRIVPLFCIAAALLACSSSIDLPEDATAEQQFRAGLERYRNGSYQEALSHFEIIRLQFPGSAVADSARYFSALSRFERGEYLLASYEFNQIIQGGAARELVADAYYQFAQCYYELSPKVQLDQTYTRRAIDALQNFVEGYPSHPKAQEVERQVLELVSRLAEKEYKTAILYEKMEVPISALIYYNTVVDRYYNTEYADEAMAGKIRSLLALRRYSEAASAAKEFLERYPDSPYRSDVETNAAEASNLLQQAESR
ncbi:MAG: outer membrane protein assembly factor BamD [Bacteroidetes bacterium]|nr:outer membrane protein assembly factor BamD [Bacteroidota bacterium]